jgi:hypothetical protein
VVIRTDAADPALSGHGFAFTIGRGNDVQLAAIRLLEPFLAGQDLDEVLADLGDLVSCCLPIDHHRRQRSFPVPGRARLPGRCFLPGRFGCRVGRWTLVR